MAQKNQKNQGLFISNDILIKNQLSLTDKVILAQIIFLRKKKVYCCDIGQNIGKYYYYTNVSNDYLSKSLNIPLSTVKRSLKSLIANKEIIITKKKKSSKSRHIYLYEPDIIDMYLKWSCNGKYNGYFQVDFK